MLTIEKPRRMSVTDWALVESGELVDGVWVEEETRTALHEAVVAAVFAVLETWSAPRGGLAFASDLKMIVRERCGRKPDVSVYVAGTTFPGRQVGATKRPPTLVVEVLSSQARDVQRDAVEKLAEYSAFGVRYYWLVDPVARTLEIRELRIDGPATMLLAVATGTHAVPGCDGLVVDLDALWAGVARLPKSDAA